MKHLKHISDALPLKVFIRKAQVIQLYRSILKHIQKIDDDYVKRDLKSQVTSGFRKNISLKDSEVPQALREATDHLKFIQTMVQRRSAADDSWLASSTESDEKGRVGTGWPWQK